MNSDKHGFLAAKNVQKIHGPRAMTVRKAAEDCRTPRRKRVRAYALRIGTTLTSPQITGFANPDRALFRCAATWDKSRSAY